MVVECDKLRSRTAHGPPSVVLDYNSIPEVGMRVAGDFKVDLCSTLSTHVLVGISSRQLDYFCKKAVLEFSVAVDRYKTSITSVFSQMSRFINMFMTLEEGIRRKDCK